MNSRRTVIIAAALALAFLAAGISVYYVNGAQNRAYNNAKLVQVWVVKKAIPKGTDGAQAISQDFVTSGKIPQAYHPGSAVNNINDIKNKVALTDLAPGQIIVGGLFVPAAQAATTFAGQLPSGQVAITVSLDQVHAVGGLLQPGDKVDMLVNVADPNDDKKITTSVMYQNVNILAIGANTASAQAAAANDTSKTTAAAAVADSGLITFSLPLEAAQNVVLVSSGSSGAGGSIYLALVRQDNAPIAKPDGVQAPPNVNGSTLNIPGLPQTPYPAQ